MIILEDIFGKAENNADELANTNLTVTNCKMYVRWTLILLEMSPISKVTAEFLQETVSGVLDAIKSSAGKALAIIADNNRTNHQFFNKYYQEEDIISPSMKKHIYIYVCFFHVKGK